MYLHRRPAQLAWWDVMTPHQVTLRFSSAEDPKQSFSVLIAKIICYDFLIYTVCIQMYTVENKCIYNVRTIKVCINCSWRCPGTSAPTMAHFLSFPFLCSSGAMHEASWVPLKDKKHFKGLRRKQGSCWEEQKKIVFPRQGVINLPSSQINDFFSPVWLP